MRWLWCVILACGSLQTARSGSPAFLSVSPAEHARAESLVRELGDPRYLVRDKAYRELEKMGRKAIRALEAGLKVEQTETRLRCEKLLPRAEADEMKARVAAFMADTRNEFEHDLPGWPKYLLIAGDSKTTRELFAASLTNTRNHAILLAMKGIPKSQTEPLASLVGGFSFTGVEHPLPARYTPVLDQFRYAIYEEHLERLPNGGTRQITPRVADHALLMLAESLVNEKEIRFNQFSYQSMNWLYQTTLRDAARGNSEYKQSYQRILLNYFETRDGLNTLSQAVNLVQYLNLGQPMVARMASKLLLLEGAQPWTKALALTMIARTNQREVLQLIKKFIADETIVVKAGPNNPLPDIQVRDVALAMALLMTNQQPKNYGYELQHVQDAMKFNYTNYYFRDENDSNTAEKKREAAIRKWQEWDTTQLGSITGMAISWPTPEKK